MLDFGFQKWCQFQIGRAFPKCLEGYIVICPHDQVGYSIIYVDNDHMALLSILTAVCCIFGKDFLCLLNFIKKPLFKNLSHCMQK